MAEESTEHQHPSLEFDLLLNWWRELEGKRGDRVALRRASNIEEVLFNPAFHRLWRNLRNTRWSNAERVALVAALAARVKIHDPSASFPAQMGAARGGRDKPVLSELRFRRLLQIREREGLLQACSRAIALLGGTANLCSLADSAYWWNDRIRKQWAFEYYDATPSFG